MRKYLPFLSFVVLLAIAFAASSTYRNAKPGEVLYNRYFEAQTPAGAGITRAAVGEAAADPDVSILEQGKRYYQSEDYDLALVSLRAYLEANPTPEDYLPELLAGTAAMATGHYSEGKRYLQRLPESHAAADAAALWYLSLLDLREENLSAARGKLQLLADQRMGAEYPVTEVLQKLAAK